MRDSIKEYQAVEEAAMKFVKSVAEGNSKYARELFTDEAVLFGYLDGKLEHGSIEQFYHNVDTVAGGENFKARVDVLFVEETLAAVRVLEESWGGRIDFTDVLLLLKMNGEWKYVKRPRCETLHLPHARFDDRNLRRRRQGGCNEYGLGRRMRGKHGRTQH